MDIGAQELIIMQAMLYLCCSQMQMKFQEKLVIYNSLNQQLRLKHLLILIVEDDSSIAELLCDSLKDWGYEVDYIKDFLSITEQMAKIQALIRRTYTFQKQNNMIEHHGLILLIDENAISYNGQKVDLTKNEFKILELLLKNKGCPISKKDLMIKLWNNDCFVSDNTLFVNIARLRKTLKNIGLPDSHKERYWIYGK